MKKIKLFLFEPVFSDNRSQHKTEIIKKIKLYTLNECQIKNMQYFSRLLMLCYRQWNRGYMYIQQKKNMKNLSYSP